VHCYHFMVLMVHPNPPYLNVFAHELQIRTNGRPTADQIFDAVAAVHKRCSGGYAVVAMIIGHGIVAFRDPNGIRPIVIGRRETDSGAEYMVASESVALDLLQFEKLRDIRPGEAVFIENEGVLHSREYSGATSYSPCIFEFVYFARPDSIIDNLSVYKARLRMGEQLAGQIVREWPDHDIDVVIPIPDTSRTAAVPVAYHLGTKYREGFIKNRYIGRTFIMPGQEERAKSVRHKLNALALVIAKQDDVVAGARKLHGQMTGLGGIVSGYDRIGPMRGDVVHEQAAKFGMPVNDHDLDAHIRLLPADEVRYIPTAVPGSLASSATFRSGMLKLASRRDLTASERASSNARR